VADVGAGRLVHEGGVVAVGLGQADLVRNVGVDPLDCGGLGGKGRVVLLHQILLHPNPLLLFVSLLVSNHLQVLNLGFRSRRQPFLHPLLRIVQASLQLFPLGLELDNVGLAHRQLGNGCFHLSGQISESALELVDLF